MRKTLHRFFVVLLLVVAVARVSVASSGIAVTLVRFTMDTVNVSLGYTLTISAEVRNTDTVYPFGGYLDFGLHNNSTTITSPDVFNEPPYSGNQIYLGPGEVIPAVFSIHIDDPYFAPGPDVVVVWPISSRPISDSILIHLLIENPSNVTEKEKDEFTYIVMSDRILLQYSASEINFQQVRIFNILGQQASYFHADFITEIPVPNLPKGIYLCEMIAADKRTRVIKFYH